VTEPLRDYVPESLRPLLDDEFDLRTAIPDLASDEGRLRDIEKAVESVETTHTIRRGDSRDIELAYPVDLVVTSPPYLDLIEYDGDEDGQIGDISEIESFREDLRSVWRECYDSLVPGGRMCVVVGDVLRSRSDHGRHRMIPIHASILEDARRAGFDSLAPIIWYKIGNTGTESGDRSRFLGKPYEPGAVIENDVEYILLFRKPGGYRSPSDSQRLLSTIPADYHQTLFTQVWDDLPGARREDHPAPYPESLAERLVTMFSFVGDRILDPFGGTGTTGVAASRLGRDSLSVEISPEYVRSAENRLRNEANKLTNLDSMSVSVDGLEDTVATDRGTGDD